MSEIATYFPGRNITRPTNLLLLLGLDAQSITLLLSKVEILVYYQPRARKLGEVKVSSVSRPITSHLTAHVTAITCKTCNFWSRKSCSELAREMQGKNAITCLLGSVMMIRDTQVKKLSLQRKKRRITWYVSLH